MSLNHEIRPDAHWSGSQAIPGRNGAVLIGDHEYKSACCDRPRNEHLYIADKVSFSPMEAVTIARVFVAMERQISRAWAEDRRLDALKMAEVLGCLEIRLFGLAWFASPLTECRRHAWDGRRIQLNENCSVATCSECGVSALEAA